MLKTLRLRNFKAFKNTGDIPLAPITLIYGPNSAGKSSIIQSLLLLKQSVDGRSDRFPGLVPQGALTDLGSYRSLVHGHDGRLDLEFDITSHDVTRDVDNRHYLRFRRMRSTGGAVDVTDLVQYRFSTDDVPDFEIDLARDGPATTRARRKDPVWSARKRVFRWSSEESWQSLVDFYNGNWWSNSERKKRLDRQRVLARQIGERSISADLVVEQLQSLRDAAVQSDDSTEILDGLIERSIDHARIDSDSAAREDTADLARQLADESEGVEARTVAEYASILEHCRVDAFNLLPSRLRSVRTADLRRHDFIPEHLQNMLELSASSFYKFVSSLVYLGPLRSHPGRHHVATGGDMFDVGTKGEFTPEVLYTRWDEMGVEVNRWLKQFGIQYELDAKGLGDPVTGQIISIRLKDGSGLEVAPSDVGFGIGQLLPVIVQGIISAVQGGSIVCVEQPEIHLHPRLQANVGDFLAETAGVLGSSNTIGGVQWIVETHSEALALRLRRRIKEGALSASDVCFLYVESDGHGKSSVKRLRLDDRGEFLDEWPGGFFEEGFYELFPEVAE